jgi:hypothetical protein
VHQQYGSAGVIEKLRVWDEQASLHSPAAALKFNQLKAHTLFRQIAHLVNCLS